MAAGIIYQTVTTTSGETVELAFYVDDTVTPTTWTPVNRADITSVPTDPFGANADAASATGSVSAKLRAIATALGTTALDLGSGTGGTRTLRMAMDSAQLADARTTYAAIAGAPAQQVALPTDHPTIATATDTSRVLNGASGVSLTPKWATIAVSSSGDNSIVALVSGKKIRVLFWDLTPNAAVNAKWRSNTTDKTGLYYMASQGNGHARSFNPVGWFETASGEALQLNLSGAVAVGGIVGYVEV